MASRPTYILVCDLCAEVFTPRVHFASEECFTHEMQVPRMLSEVRAEARASGWTAHYVTPSEGARRQTMAYPVDHCPGCAGVLHPQTERAGSVDHQGEPDGSRSL
jgi:hypothetical protein